MALDSIITHIEAQASGQAESIMQQAREQEVRLLNDGKAAAKKLYRDLLAIETTRLERQKQQQLVNCRLENRKKILEIKEEILDLLFEKMRTHLQKGKIKKQLVSAREQREVPEDIDFYLEKLRRDFETEIAAMLFS
jgi:vacuolar-type H+-ATPase subunit E/Vma4